MLFSNPTSPVNASLLNVDATTNESVLEVDKISFSFSIKRKGRLTHLISSAMSCFEVVCCENCGKQDTVCIMAINKAGLKAFPDLRLIVLMSDSHTKSFLKQKFYFWASLKETSWIFILTSMSEWLITFSSSSSCSQSHLHDVKYGQRRGHVGVRRPPWPKILLRFYFRPSEAPSFLARACQT